jgi:cation diffusion facilitator CzcD-associated flavoprotein CzcO
MGSIGYQVLDSDFTHPIISERAIDEPRPLKVIYIGAGVSGICAAIQFPRYVPNIELVIYDKNADVGGTWFENRYPGCACDVPAHSYQLSFESSTEWSKFYSGAAEILKYWQRVTEKYGIRKYMRFRHKCVEARFNEATSKWHVTLHDLTTDTTIEEECDVFMTGMGALNEWKWPDIPGLHSFKGPVLHSASWDSTFDPKDKNVAVIGAGSSGIQIVPSILPAVKHMDHYIRGRTWIASTFGHEVVREHNDGQDGNFEYSAEEKEAWKKDPESYVKYRKALEQGMQGGHAVTQKGSKEHTTARQEFDQDMRRRLKDKPEIIDHLLPNFPPLCKRLTPGPGYLEALTSEKVDVIPQKIKEVTEMGITTEDGKQRQVDAIVCATGFDTSFQGRIPIIGRGGQNLQDRYKMRPETYLSISVDGFPNFFQSLGPNAGVGNGSLLIILEAIHLYVGQILRKLATENVKTIEPKRQVVKNFTDCCDAYFERTVFSAECGSWYKSSPPGTSPEERKKGRVTALWPGSSIHVVKALERVRWEDFNMEYADGNEFGWFGNGWTSAEHAKDGEGLSWYLNGTNFVEEDLKPSTESQVNGDVRGKEALGENKVPEGIAAT